MRDSTRFLFSLCLAVLLSGFSLVAQLVAQSKPQATISGTISDPGGAAVGGASIAVREVSASEPAATTISDADGHFSLSLQPGRYRVLVSRESFRVMDQEINLAAGESRQLNWQMSLEPLSLKVLVTSQALPVAAASSPAPADILTRAQIDQRIASSLPDLLVTLPGFSLGRTGPEGGTTALFLDGGNSNYTKVLIDGIPANQPGGLIDFSPFTVDNIEKIEVVHGAQSALYGSDAMAGVIQIFTRRGAPGIPQLTAFAEGGNFSTGHGGAELAGSLGHFNYSGGVSDLETQGQGPNDAFRLRTLSGNFGWRFSDTAHLSFILRDAVSDAGTPGQSLLFPANLTDSIAQHNFNSGMLADFNSGAHWHHQLLTTETYYREHNIDPFFPTSYQYNRVDLSGQSSYIQKTVGVTAGYQYEIENGFLSTTSDGGLSLAQTHARRNNQAGYLDARWQPIGRVTMNAGARVENNATFGTRVIPRAGISYTLRSAQGAWGDTRLHVTYGQGIVEPRFDQAYGTDPCFPGDPHLRAEESRSVHAGIDQKLDSGRWRFSADYFENRFHNIISFLNAPPSAACLAIGAPFGAGAFFNTNLARARGANLSAEGRITRWLTTAANYTYDSTRTLSASSDPLNIDPNYLPGSPLLRRPLHSGSASLNANFWRLNANLSGYFTGKRADYNFPAQVQDAGYARLDLAAAYKMFHGVSIFARIANLANQHYVEVYGYPALGREYRVGIKYTTAHE